MRLELYRKKYGEAGDFIYHYKIKHGSLKLPWNRTYYMIKQRCTEPTANGFEHYGQKGIKCQIKLKELKNLFFKDKAYLLKQPSIDRIDPNQNYTASNLQWIEMDQNRRRRLLNHPMRIPQWHELWKINSEKFKEYGWDRRLIIQFARKLISDKYPY